jgi:hypothetical protein
LTEAHTFGSGPGAVRVLPRNDGCEIRFGDEMIVANKHLARMLGYLHEDPSGDALADFASAFGMPTPQMRSAIGSALANLAGVGIPAETWGPHWAEVAEASTGGQGPAPGNR